MRSRIVVRVGPRWRAQRRRAQNRAHGTGPTPTAASIAAPRSPPCTRGRRLGENTSPSPSSRYPRARGADLTMMWMWSPPFPLPPRTRGRLPSDPGGHGGAPSTPAHAGPASSLLSPGAVASLDPRARGAGGYVGRARTRAGPLPPRTRGWHAVDDDPQVRHASTPAHAGPAATCSTRSSSTPLYPRARGASFTGRTNRTRTYPLPPRTRGQRLGAGDDAVVDPSTPAHAGPARTCRVRTWGRRLYPRARGASDEPPRLDPGPPPLPPRTRGRPQHPLGTVGGVAPTPAHAGPTRGRQPP